MEWLLLVFRPDLSWPDDVEHVKDVPVKRIALPDLMECLHLGFADFLACRTDAILLCVTYPLVGLIMARLAFGHEAAQLAFPLVSGFALLGPVLATGLYEMSRRRERGETVTWGMAFSPFTRPVIEPLMKLGLVLFAIFGLWLLSANILYDATLGPVPPDNFAALIRDVFGTGAGFLLLILGTVTGAVFACAVFVISVISFPLLLDKPVTVATAVSASVRAVRLNPVPMAVWGLTVSALLVAGSVPFLVGLAVVVPVLGHATWHLYRRVIG
jgi:uncharacterized membrane protein